MLNSQPKKLKSSSKNYDDSDLNERVEKLEEDFIQFTDLTRAYVD